MQDVVVIAVDTNVLVYAHRRDSPWHGSAVQCLRTLAEGPSAWAIPWPCIHEFLAIVTHPRIYAPPSTVRKASAQVEAWLESPTLQVIGESSRHWNTLAGLLHAARVPGPRVHDARIAAICINSGVRELLTADRDFSRFPALATRNPLIEG
jgi:uncharacterized protein